MPRMRAALLLAAASMILAGCTTTVSGEPVAVRAATPVTGQAPTTTTTSAAPAHHVDPQHVTSADALGDVTTISACSLIDLIDLPARYGVGTQIPTDNLDGCEFFTPDAATPVVATVGLLEDYSTATVAGVKRFMARSGGMRIAVLDDDADGCSELLVFADNVTMAADVWPEDEAVKGSMCDLATKLLDDVIAKVTADGPRHRDYRDHSLATQDACHLLAAEDAELAGGGTAKSLASYPAHHRCLYGAAAKRVQVVLDFGVDDASIGDGKNWTHTTIAGRDSVVEPDLHPDEGSITYCVVMLRLIPIDDAGHGDTMETAEITVRIAHGNPVPCTQAKKIAEVVWKRLPTP